jgi:hypothetical protein
VPGAAQSAGGALAGRRKPIEHPPGCDADHGIAGTDPTVVRRPMRLRAGGNRGPRPSVVGTERRRHAVPRHLVPSDVELDVDFWPPTVPRLVGPSQADGGACDGLAGDTGRPRHCLHSSASAHTKTAPGM